MGQLSRARRIAVAAVYGGGGFGAAGALFTGILIGQALAARHSIPLADAPPPRPDGRYGGEHAGTPITFAVLGDSTAAGLGVDAPRHTLGALLAAGLAEQLRRPVQLRCLAVVGSESSELPPQVERAIALHPDLVLIMIGGNDVTHRRRVPEAVSHLVRSVRALRTIGAQVVVGTCPDLGTIEPIQPPLRWLARRWSRQLATAQTIAVVEAGGRTVSLGDLLGPAFEADPARMFSRDRFHPSAEGYALAAAAILPTLIAASGKPDETAAALHTDEGLRSLPEAAAEAAGRAGTEVSSVRVAGRDRGPAGRWAELRHRGWRRIEVPTDPGASDPPVRLAQGQQPVGES